jgi:hypothetical protein
MVAKWSKSASQAWVERRLKRVLVWLCFVVFFALLPLIFAYVYEGMRGSKMFNLNEFLKGGELFLVTAAVAADSIGRLVSDLLFAEPPRNMRLLDLVFLVMSLGIVTFATLEYSMVKSGGALDAAFVGSQSCYLFLGILCIGMGVVVLSVR